MEVNKILKKYDVFIGLEIHAALLTKSKAFSPSKVDFDEKPNLNINEIDLGYPGIKPLTNKKMIELAYLSCKLLNMKIDKIIRFDRKNYFYPDLAKGYQITQKFHPIGKDGYFEILNDNNKFKKINIKTLHMEEDTAKQIVEKDIIKYDFNRSGIPLIEIVTDFTSFANIDEVILFLEQIKEMLFINKISNGNMSRGDFRVDLNISLRKKRHRKYNNKVEIKNLNSLRNVRKAIINEIKEQYMSLEKKDQTKEVTKRFEEATQENVVMREKDKDQHYNFITETNIIPITLGSEFLKRVESHKVYVLKGIKKTFIRNEIPKTQGKVIISSMVLFELFNYYSNKHQSKDDLKKIVAFLSSRFQEAIKKTPIPYNRIDKETLLYIIKLFYKDKINSNEIKDVLRKLLLNDNNLKKELGEFEKRVVLSDDQIKRALKHFIKENPIEYNKHLKNKAKLQGFLIGKLLIELKGQANPKKIKEIVDEHINGLET